jgi:hypothetical protein
MPKEISYIADRGGQDEPDSFRAVARTIIDEVLGVRPDYIEHQLAHAVRDPNGRAYNRRRIFAEAMPRNFGCLTFMRVNVVRTLPARLIPICHAAHCTDCKIADSDVVLARLAGRRASIRRGNVESEPSQQT